MQEAAAESGQDAARPTHVVLAHPVFTRVEGISFRRAATDRAPVMVVPFGERDAAVPLTGLRHEFAIADNSPDGEMLDLIAEALCYVQALLPGDKLPPEIASGDASWSASVLYRHRATTRLRLSLLKWHKPDAVREAGGDERCAERLDKDPELRTLVQNAQAAAAQRLGLASISELARQVETLAGEFAYIEALREELLQRVKLVTVRATRVLAANSRLDGRRADALSRMLKLNAVATAQFQDRFDVMDAQVDDIVGLLGTPESQIAFIHSNRNTLHRHRLGWTPLLTRWDAFDPVDDTLLWGIIVDTYQFLAQRHLPATEWPSFNALRTSLGKSRTGMSW